jgi:hypothetical protein
MSLFKTTVWSLTTDNDGGLWTSVHTTREALEEAAWGYLEVYWDCPRSQIIEDFDGETNPFEVWQAHLDDPDCACIDNMTWNEHDILVEV